MKKLFAMILAAAMCLSLCVPAFADSTQPHNHDTTSSSVSDKRVRRTITLNSEDEIIDFLKSDPYNPNVSYTFICPSQIQTRILCPRCNNNRFYGTTEHREMNVCVRPCPNIADFESDICVEYHVYAYSSCDYCGYKTTPSFGYKYWLVQCHVEMPDGWGTYIARPGQSYTQGYDFHEDPVYMELM